VIDNLKILALIPARGGSRRLPGKNILPLAGKPLIAWTIDAAKGCPYLDEICVSTDDRQITEAALAAGASVPFTRPEALSNDVASSVDVALHAIECYRLNGREFDCLILLQPTSPLRTASDISFSLEIFRDKKATAVIGVCEADHSPLWMNTLPEGGSMNGFMREEVRGKRSQDLPTYYRINGSIYAIDTRVLERLRSFFPPDGAMAYIMPPERSIDIDTRLDFTIVEAIVSKNPLMGAGH